MGVFTLVLLQVLGQSYWPSDGCIARFASGQYCNPQANAIASRPLTGKKWKHPFNNIIVSEIAWCAFIRVCAVIMSNMVISQSLTHLCLTSHKKGIGKRCKPRSDVAECGVWSGSTQSAFNTGISIKHGNNSNQPNTPYIENGPVQRLKVEESSRHK